MNIEQLSRVHVNATLLLTISGLVVAVLILNRRNHLPCVGRSLMQLNFFHSITIIGEMKSFSSVLLYSHLS